ncbi:MAG: hypothetical protein ABSG39_14540 [Acidimicrobiales bacterium]
MGDVIDLDAARTRRCESCGARATVTLDDGSTWCESCDLVARCLDELWAVLDEAEGPRRLAVIRDEPGPDGRAQHPSRRRPGS